MIKVFFRQYRDIIYIQTIMMSFFKSFPQISLLTATSIIGSVFFADLPAKAATFSFSESTLSLNSFSINPQNPSADSNRETIAVSTDELDFADAIAEGTISVLADSDSAFVDTDFFTDVFGEGNSFFGFGESSSLTLVDFSLDPDEILRFDFQASLDIFNDFDSLTDGSISTFSEVTFSLFDDNTNELLGNFTANSNIDTNLLTVDNDFISVDSSSNVAFEDNSFEDFEGNIEEAQLFVGGSFEYSSTSATQVRLEVATLNRSCVQAPITDDPCTRIPEPDNAVALIFGFLGLGLVSRLAKKI